MPQNGDVISLGTLKVNGTLYAMPSNPVNGGDCVNYNGTAISIENTVSGKALRWIYAEIDGKKLLICDRCLVVNCTWNNLNSAGLIMGKNITIDGQPYKVRSLTGGVNANDKNNEWSKIIELNQLGIGNSNSIWHWQNMYTWCQETYSENSVYRALRGYSSAANWNNNNATNNNTNIGWRPAL